MVGGTEDPGRNHDRHGEGGRAGIGPHHDNGDADRRGDRHACERPLRRGGRSREDEEGRADPEHHRFVDSDDEPEAERDRNRDREERRERGHRVSAVDLELRVRYRVVGPDPVNQQVEHDADQTGAEVLQGRERS